MNSSMLVNSFKYLYSHDLISSLSSWISREIIITHFSNNKLSRILSFEDLILIKITIRLCDNILLLKKFLIDAYKYDYQIIKSLIRRCIELDNTFDVQFNNNYLLRILVNENCIKGVNLLLHCFKVDVHANDEDALVIAVRNKYIDMVKLLIDSGANIHARNDRPLRIACLQHNIEMVKLLLQIETDDVSIQNKHVKRIKIIKMILEYRAIIDNKPLMISIGNDRRKIIKLLSEYRITISDKSLKRINKYKYTEIIEMLLNKNNLNFMRKIELK